MLSKQYMEYLRSLLESGQLEKTIYELIDVQLKQYSYNSLQLFDAAKNKRGCLAAIIDDFKDFISKIYLKNYHSFL